MSSRYSKQLINQLNTSTNIVDLIQTVTQLKSKGKNLTGICPFHNEKTPSFTVTPEKNMYYCFGCHAHGRPLDFLINYHKMNFMSAVEHLAKLNGINLHENLDPSLELLNKVSCFCQDELKKNTIVTQYVNKRGISEKIIQKYRIGYMPRITSNALCSILHCTSQDLVIIGVLNPQSQKIRFSNRLIFPISNKIGQVIGFGGRTLQADFQPKYINSPETNFFKKSSTIYGLDHLRGNDHLIVVEGYMDVVQLAEFDIPNCVAVLGTSLTDTHLKMLINNAKKITFCFDGDNAGEKASLKAAYMCLPFLGPKCELKILKLPNGHDPDSFLKEHSNNTFVELLDNAHDVSNVIVNSLVSTMSINTAIGKSRFREKIKKVSKEITDFDFRNEFFQISNSKIQPQTNTNKIIINQQQSWIDHLISIVVCNPSIVLDLDKNTYDKVLNCETNQRDIKILILMIEKIWLQKINDPKVVISHCRNAQTKNQLLLFLKKGVQLDYKQQTIELEQGIKKIIKLKYQSRKKNLMSLSRKRGLNEDERNELLKLISVLNDG